VNNIKVNINGKKIDLFIKKIVNNDIELFNIEYISNSEINIIIDKKDYYKIKKIKTIYKIKIVKKYGIDNLKDIIKYNKIIFLFLFICIIILIFLSNIIFSIKVVHNDEEIRDIIFKELNNNGIKIHGFKKNKKEINKIKDKILVEYKDKIEWLEIENIGTSYIVRLQTRIIPQIDDKKANRNVVAKKNAVIKKIEAIAGNVDKQRGEYVKKGDIIINGSIKLNESIKENIAADGIVFGEVWYTTTVSYPFIYQEDITTNEETTNIIYNFLNKEKILYGKKYKYKKNIETKKISSSFLPIYISIEKNKQLKKIDYILTCDQAINKATIKGKKKMESKLKDSEYIISTKILSTKCDINSAIVEIFYAVYENITDYQIIN